MLEFLVSSQKHGILVRNRYIHITFCHHGINHCGIMFTTNYCQIVNHIPVAVIAALWKNARLELGNRENRIVVEIKIFYDLNNV